MSYEKTVWVNGQAPALDSDHLNKMEQGIADAVSVTPQTLSDGQKTQARGNIDAAPGGFGLGQANMKALEDCDNATLSGWYATDSPTLNTPGEDGESGVLLVNRRIDKRIYQEFHAINGNEYSRWSAARISYGDDSTGLQWGPWEYVNPMLMLGIEYRTTERYLGKPVYVKLFDCGTIPAQGTHKDLVFSPDVDSIVSVTAYSPIRGNTLPYYDANGVRCSITGSGSTVMIWNYSEPLMDTNVRALIKYTKTTD